MAGGCWNCTITWLFIFSWLINCIHKQNFGMLIWTRFYSPNSIHEYLFFEGRPHRTLLNCENLMVPVTIFLTMPAYLVFLQNEAIFNYLSPLQLVGIYFKFKIFYSLALVTLSYKSKLYSRCLLLLCFFLAECL